MTEAIDASLPAAWSMRQNERVSDLIDTTEMYLRTIYELVEEGIVPLRARIAERLHQSGPTVSQTVARMERDGLLTVEGDRHLAADRRGHAAGDAGDAQAPARRAAPHRRDRARVGARARGGVPLGARHVGDRRAASAEAARPPDRVAVRQPDPGPGRARRARGRGELHGGSSSRCPSAASSAEGRVLVRRISEEMQKDEILMSAMRRVGCAAGQDRDRRDHRRGRARRLRAARPPRSSLKRPITSSCASSDPPPTPRTLRAS